MHHLDTFLIILYRLKCLIMTALSSNSVKVQIYYENILIFLDGTAFYILSNWTI